MRRKWGSEEGVCSCQWAQKVGVVQGIAFSFGIEHFQLQGRIGVGAGDVLALEGVIVGEQGRRGREDVRTVLRNLTLFLLIQRETIRTNA